MVNIKKLLRLLFIVSIFILLNNCSEKEKTPGVVYLSTTSTDFEDALKPSETIIIKDLDSSFVGINKIIEFDNEHFLFIDKYACGGYITTRSGLNTKKVFSKGKAPNEVLSMGDIIADQNQNIYLLDIIGSQIKKYNSNFDLIDKYGLSYTHRMPFRIYLRDNLDDLFVVAVRNLKDGATSLNYEFLTYSDNKLINEYSNDFKLKRSFLSPDQRLEFTKGVFLRPYVGYATLAYWKDMIICGTEEGFYDLHVFDRNLEKSKTIKISDPEFVEFNVNRAKEYDFDNPDLKIDQEVVGELIARHSRIVNIFVLSDKLIVVKLKPFENYFPYYAKNIKQQYVMDVFDIVGDSFNIEARYSNIELGDKEVIGAIDNKYLALSLKSENETENSKRNKIELYEVL